MKEYGIDGVFVQRRNNISATQRETFQQLQRCLSVLIIPPEPTNNKDENTALDNKPVRKRHLN